MDSTLTMHDFHFSLPSARIEKAVIILQLILAVMLFQLAAPVSGEMGRLVFLRNQRVSILLYNQLLDRMKVDDVCEDRFPEYYCGSYVNDAGRLVLLANDSNQAEELIEDIDDNLVMIEEGTVPVNYLNDTVREITVSQKELLNEDVTINCTYTDVMTGKVIICLNELNETGKELIRNRLSHPGLVEFIQAEAVPEELQLEVGDYVVSGANGAACSIGFKAIDNKGNIGYVISGHAGDFVGEQFMYNDMVTGAVTRTTYVNPSTPADAAFVILNKEFNLKNQLSPHLRVYAAQTYEYPQHCLIDMCGSVSGFQEGRIMSNNMTFYSPFVTLTKQVLASYTSTGGDSGGPIMIPDYEEDGVIMYSVIGIHLGSVKAFKIRVGAYYTRYRYISQALAISYWDK